MSGRILVRPAFQTLQRIENFATARPKLKPKGPLLISCKRKELDHYLGVRYDKFDEIPLASKGWNHSKSKHDHFTVHPLPKDVKEETYQFKEFSIEDKVIEALASRDIYKATEFQASAYPAVYEQKHAMLAAETGCGKTVAYLLPIVQRLINNQQSKHLNTPKVVVLVPNRELAYQVGDMAEAMCSPVGLVTKTLVGGRTKKLMLNPDFEDVDILVATPGALSKLATIGIYKLDKVQTLVMDEADTLIDDSFIERIERLVNRMSQAQLVMVSATLPKKLPDILIPYSETMEQIISPKLHMPLLNVVQHFMRITRSVKPANLLNIAKLNKQPMIVFTNRNETCKWLSMFLCENNVPCSNISGDVNYAIRVEQWNQFVRGDTKVLSATDVGSRGLNTIQVKHVVNYDFPLYAADYIHRIGRVGRLGSYHNCQVTNFVTGPQEVQLVQQIELSIRKNQPLTNVDGNITGIIQKKILRKIRESS